MTSKQHIYVKSSIKVVLHFMDPLTDMIRINMILKRNEMGLGRDKVFLLAVCIEKKLFKTAANLQTYSNFQTLEERIKNVSTIVGIKLLSMHKARRKNLFIEDYKKKLQEKVGSSLCDEIFKIVDDVSVIKKSFSICKLQSEKGNNVPTVVRAIFYDTRLIHAFQKFQLKGVINQPWELLIQEAKHNIQCYREFEARAELKNGSNCHKKFTCSFKV